MSRGVGTGDGRGSPYAPHTPAETEAMLEAIGVDGVEDLFDIPQEVQFDGEFGIAARSEQAVRRELTSALEQNEDLVEFLGRGHYDHYVPAIVDSLSQRSEFLTSYTQYQPEIAQGFLQALFEYQSLLVELTGLGVANCSMYDAATALGEAALLASRVRETEGTKILVPDSIRPERRSVLENYVTGSDLVVGTYEMAGGDVDVSALSATLGSETAMVYTESPTTEGVISEALADVGTLADDANALLCVGTDPLALALLERPSDVGADVVVGDAVLGLPAAYGMGLGLFATREDFLRQVPGRLVGVSEDAAGDRAYTLTLQTREQHIRRERATSNICTNQAWVALRAAIHAAYLGPEGLRDLARDCVQYPRELAQRMDTLDGVSAPVHNRHHFREFLAETERDAREIREGLAERGYAIHAVDTNQIQVCVTETTVEHTDGLIEAMEEVV